MVLCLRNVSRGLYLAGDCTIRIMHKEEMAEWSEVPGWDRHSFWLGRSVVARAANENVRTLPVSGNRRDIDKNHVLANCRDRMLFFLDCLVCLDDNRPVGPRRFEDVIGLELQMGLTSTTRLGINA